MLPLLDQTPEVYKINKYICIGWKHWTNWFSLLLKRCSHFRFSGSIRLPASFCGITGLKPTNGLVSRYGLIAYASSLETVGPMASSVKDVAYIMAAIAGRDSRDATSYDVPDDAKNCFSSLPDAADLDSKPLAGLKIGMIENTLGEGVQQQVRDAVTNTSSTLLSSLGAHVSSVNIKSFTQVWKETVLFLCFPFCHPHSRY